MDTPFYFKPNLTVRPMEYPVIGDTDEDAEDDEATEQEGCGKLEAVSLPCKVREDDSDNGTGSRSA